MSRCSLTETADEGTPSERSHESTASLDASLADTSSVIWERVRCWPSVRVCVCVCACVRVFDGEGGRLRKGRERREGVGGLGRGRRDPGTSRLRAPSHPQTAATTPTGATDTRLTALVPGRVDLPKGLLESRELVVLVLEEEEGGHEVGGRGRPHFGPPQWRHEGSSVTLDENARRVAALVGVRQRRGEEECQGEGRSKRGEQRGGPHRELGVGVACEGGDGCQLDLRKER